MAISRSKPRRCPRGAGSKSNARAWPKRAWIDPRESAYLLKNGHVRTGGYKWVLQFHPIDHKIVMLSTHFWIAFEQRNILFDRRGERMVADARIHLLVELKSGKSVTQRKSKRSNPGGAPLGGFRALEADKPSTSKQPARHRPQKNQVTILNGEPLLKSLLSSSLKNRRRGLPPPSST